MENQANFIDLLFRVAISLMVCDRDVDAQEIKLINEQARKYTQSDYDVKNMLITAVSDYNQRKQEFVSQSIKDLAAATLSDDNKSKIIHLGFEMVKADMPIKYNERHLFYLITTAVQASNNQIRQWLPELNKQITLREIGKEDRNIGEELYNGIKGSAFVEITPEQLKDMVVGL